MAGLQVCGLIRQLGLHGGALVGLRGGEGVADVLALDGHVLPEDALRETAILRLFTEQLRIDVLRKSEVLELALALVDEAVLHLTERSRIAKAHAAGVVALKLYPAGATTNSDAGVTDIRNTYATLEAMQKHGLKLLVHGEVTSNDIDLFDREAVFIDRHLIPLRRDFPELKIVFEHITTREAAQYVASADRYTGATITAHHLLFNRNALFLGGVRPHYYCLPVLKREEHRLALLKAATQGGPQFFLGTDSAPHPAALKEHASGCAGCYTAHAAIEMYAEAFDSVDALDRLEAFASFHGPDFYGLPRNTSAITLERQDWRSPVTVPFGEAELKPLRGGEVLPWRLTS